MTENSLQLLYLDADNTPLVDPTGLFEWPEFKTWGNIFWPDYMGSGRFEVKSNYLQHRHTVGLPIWIGKLEFPLSGQMISHVSLTNHVRFSKNAVDMVEWRLSSLSVLPTSCRDHHLGA